MKIANLLQAIEIISKSHSTKVVINHVEPNGQVSKVLESPTLEIVDCCASVVENLKKAGFTLSMHKGKMFVDDFAKV